MKKKSYFECQFCGRKNVKSASIKEVAKELHKHMYEKHGAILWDIGKKKKIYTN